MNGDQQAFPSDFVDGLTIRQQFSAMAMQGLVASTDWNESAATDGHIKHSAELSVKYADALIAELNKTTTP